jgi:hypothetical protein
MSISFYENVLDSNFANYLFRDGCSKFDEPNYCWKTNYTWEPRIVKSSHTVLVRKITGDDENTILTQLKNCGIINSAEGYYVMNYLWTKLSYIPWHTDGHVDEAVTVYLNPEWNPDWGGCFLYIEDENTNQVKGYLPKFNTAIRNGSHMWHTVTPISLDSTCPRHTLQIFKK